jgi:hypothetical protein
VAADLSPEAVTRAAEAAGITEDTARAALEAAAPILAGAWGLTDRERQQEQMRQLNQNLLGAAAEYYRLAYPEAAGED